MKIITLTDAEIELLKIFLEELSEHQSYAGCNDMDMENTNENWEIHLKAEELNSKEELEFAQTRPPLDQKINSTDSMLLDYIRHRMGI